MSMVSKERFDDMRRSFWNETNDPETANWRDTYERTS